MTNDPQGYCACTKQRRSDCRRGDHCSALRVKRLDSIPCIVGGCPRRSVGNHAICQRHLVYEITIMVVGFGAGIAAFIAAIIHWGGR